jgi:hypothetical protein
MGFIGRWWLLLYSVVVAGCVLSPSKIVPFQKWFEM